MMQFRMNALTDRLFALLDLLRGQQQLTTQALAEHFGVSERTIRRDLARLQNLEVKVETLPGRGGGVTLAKGSLLPALRFTDDEALVLDRHSARKKLNLQERLRVPLSGSSMSLLKALVNG
jgi:predicted DNA-binding transcriptional regulator YafY